MPHSPSTVGKASRLHSMRLWYLVSKGFYERCLHPPDQFWQDQMQRVGLGGLDIARLTEAVRQGVRTCGFSTCHKWNVNLPGLHGIKHTYSR
ncbi:hypothetical protein ABKN59_002971 [Abortiporus biennis]